MKLLKIVLLSVAVVTVASCKNQSQEETVTTSPEISTQQTPEPVLTASKVEPKCPHAKAMQHDCPHAKVEKSGCPHAAEGQSNCDCKKSEGQKTHDCPHHKEGSAPGTDNIKGEITCPVGGEVIEDISKAYKSEYKGKTYYFGCKGCKAKFDAEPEKYVTE